MSEKRGCVNQRGRKSRAHKRQTGAKGRLFISHVSLANNTVSGGFYYSQFECHIAMDMTSRSRYKEPASGL